MLGPQGGLDRLDLVLDRLDLVLQGLELGVVSRSSGAHGTHLGRLGVRLEVRHFCFFLERLYATVQGNG